MSKHQTPEWKEKQRQKRKIAREERLKVETEAATRRIAEYHDAKSGTKKAVEEAVKTMQEQDKDEEEYEELQRLLNKKGGE